jgi:hypothetical protein
MLQSTAMVLKQGFHVPEGDHSSWAWQAAIRCLLQCLQLSQSLLQCCWVELQGINLRCGKQYTKPS